MDSVYRSDRRKHITRGFSTPTPLATSPSGRKLISSRSRYAQNSSPYDIYLSRFGSEKHPSKALISKVPVTEVKRDPLKSKLNLVKTNFRDGAVSVPTTPLKTNQTKQQSGETLMKKIRSTIFKFLSSSDDFDRNSSVSTINDNDSGNKNDIDGGEVIEISDEDNDSKDKLSLQTSSSIKGTKISTDLSWDSRDPVSIINAYKEALKLNQTPFKSISISTSPLTTSRTRTTAIELIPKTAPPAQRQQPQVKQVQRKVQQQDQQRSELTQQHESQLITQVDEEEEEEFPFETPSKPHQKRKRSQATPNKDYPIKKRRDIAPPASAPSKRSQHISLSKKPSVRYVESTTQTQMIPVFRKRAFKVQKEEDIPKDRTKRKGFFSGSFLYESDDEDEEKEVVKNEDTKNDSKSLKSPDKKSELERKKDNQRVNKLFNRPTADDFQSLLSKKNSKKDETDSANPKFDLNSTTSLQLTTTEKEKQKENENKVQNQDKEPAKEKITCSSPDLTLDGVTTTPTKRLLGPSAGFRFGGPSPEKSPEPIKSNPSSEPKDKTKPLFSFPSSTTKTTTTSQDVSPSPTTTPVLNIDKTSESKSIASVSLSGTSKLFEFGKKVDPKPITSEPSKSNITKPKESLFSFSLNSDKPKSVLDQKSTNKAESSENPKPLFATITTTAAPVAPTFSFLSKDTISESSSKKRPSGDNDDNNETISKKQTFGGSFSTDAKPSTGTSNTGFNFSGSETLFNKPNTRGVTFDDTFKTTSAVFDVASTPSKKIFDNTNNTKEGVFNFSTPTPKSAAATTFSFNTPQLDQTPTNRPKFQLPKKKLGTLDNSNNAVASLTSTSNAGFSFNTNNSSMAAPAGDSAFSFNKPATVAPAGNSGFTLGGNNSMATATTNSGSVFGGFGINKNNTNSNENAFSMNAISTTPASAPPINIFGTPSNQPSIFGNNNGVGAGLFNNNNNNTATINNNNLNTTPFGSTTPASKPTFNFSNSLNLTPAFSKPVITETPKSFNFGGSTGQPNLNPASIFHFDGNNNSNNSNVSSMPTFGAPTPNNNNNGGIGFGSGAAAANQSNNIFASGLSNHGGVTTPIGRKLAPMRGRLRSRR